MNNVCVHRGFLHVSEDRLDTGGFVFFFDRHRGGLTKVPARAPKIIPLKYISVRTNGPHLNPVTLKPVIHVSRLGPFFCPRDSKALSEQFLHPLF